MSSLARDGAPEDPAVRSPRGPGCWARIAGIYAPTLATLAAVVAVAVTALAYDRPEAHRPVGWERVPHFVHHGLDREGRSAERIPPPDFFDWQPGDIVLIRRYDNAYGFWTHVSLRLEDGSFAEANLFDGIRRGGHGYLGSATAIRILRPDVPAALRLRAARAAERTFGRPFNILARRDEEVWWSCAKVVARSYAEAGMEIGTGLIPLPDDIAAALPDATVLHRGEAWR